MKNEQFLRHPDLLAMSIACWREQNGELRRRLGQRRLEAAVLAETMRELRDEIRELQERLRRSQDHSARINPNSHAGGKRPLGRVLADGDRPIDRGGPRVVAGPGPG
ncbi:hypothetical protein FXF51_26815 [Nonomuraea sp. PA05]|uniref:hypothetical protein n=1 Tax=Nonomuraea sp. PA05 TaxID=2604466 RepID=UPI0011D5317B|nr:hypothetical protein [Nonomuraea sp. PA05]TYB62311.1 hypothetical protein FXF51_26815 [Nonomuraea sp. PA05]